MKLTLRHELPFTTVTLDYRGRILEIPDILIDTGSATSILAADTVAAVDLLPAPEDTLRMLRGIGGIEAVFTRKVDRLTAGETSLSDFEIEIGGMDYRFRIQGILGMSFLRPTGAVLDLHQMTLSFNPLAQR